VDDVEAVAAGVAVVAAAARSPPSLITYGDRSVER